MWRISICVAFLLASVLGRAGEVRLKLNHTGPEATVELSADPGAEYLLESSRGGMNDWRPVTSFILTDPSRLWKDAAAQTGDRFFRARSMTDDDVKYADDFRLIDQNGVSRELYYYHSLATLKAIVVVFTEGNYSALAPKIAALKSSFPNNAFFWTIDTDVNTTRSNILKQATAAGITTPVYHDPLQLVTHGLDAHFSGEAFVISPAEMNIVYRGAIDDGVNNYVRAAITGLVNASTVTTTRLEPTGGEVKPTTRAVADYATVIAPLIQTKCLICHSPENIAPITYTKYEDLVFHSDHIVEEVMAARMPPWHADPQYGKFRNNTSLTPEEKVELIDWIRAGMPRGTGVDPLTAVPPPPTEWPAELGPPDQIVTIPLQQIPAKGTNAYRYIYAAATNSTDKWLKAAVVRPSNRRVVHHYIVWEGHSTSAQLSGIAGYAPGRTERPYPEGTGVFLPANSDLTFNLHYTSNGTNEVDQPQLGLWYADTPPAKQLKTISAINYLFTGGFTSIEAGNANYEIIANGYVLNNQPTLSAVIFQNPVRLYSFSPHMHFRGLRMRFELTLPGSTTKQILLSVPKYDFDWQTIYTLETPLDLPAQSRIDVIGAFDNSAQNVFNPDPTLAVKWGEQSWDEMFIGYMEYSDQ
jgi:hypothetical protein